MKPPATTMVDEKHKTVTLTESGMAKAEQMLLHRLNGGASTLENAHIKHHVDQGCARTPSSSSMSTTLVKDGQVVIVDEFTGRPCLVGAGAMVCIRLRR